MLEPETDESEESHKEHKILRHFNKRACTELVINEPQQGTAVKLLEVTIFSMPIICIKQTQQ